MCSTLFIFRPQPIFTTDLCALWKLEHYICLFILHVCHFYDDPTAHIDLVSDKEIDVFNPIVWHWTDITVRFDPEPSVKSNLVQSEGPVSAWRVFSSALCRLKICGLKRLSGFISFGHFARDFHFFRRKTNPNGGLGRRAAEIYLCDSGSKEDLAGVESDAFAVSGKTEHCRSANKHHEAWR